MIIEIRNGKVIDPGSNLEEVASVYIEHDHIKTVAQQQGLIEADKIIDATGMLVLPGMVDLNASLREPGEEAKGTVASETRAAAAGGITTLCCTPDSDPVNDSEAVTKLILNLSEQAGFAKVLPVGALSQSLQGQQLSEMYDLKEAGCVALSNGGRPIKNLAFLTNCFKYAKTQQAKIFWLPKIESMSQGCVHEGAVSAALGLRGIPVIAESIAVSQAILMAQATDLGIHLSMISSADSVQLIRRAKDDGIKVSADVAIANLLFTEDAVAHYDSRYHCYPPLRGESDRKALLQGVQDGVIDAIVSGHRPHDAAAKQAPFAESGEGMSTIELLLPMGQELDHRGELALKTFIAATTCRPAGIIDKPIGSLVDGHEADLIIVDPERQWIVSAETLLSSGKNAPFWQRQVTGKVIHTFVGGRELVFPGRG